MLRECQVRMLRDGLDKSCGLLICTAPNSKTQQNTRPMGLMDFIKGELIEIIEWTDDSRDTLSYRWPDDDKEIKRGAQLIVRESQCAQFVYLICIEKWHNSVTV